MAQTGLFNLDFPGAILYCDSDEKKNAIINYLSCKTDRIDIGIETSNPTSDDTLERAIYNTTYVHEGKHLHDHLVCPIPFHNYILKLSALYYSCHAILNWDRGIRPYKYIPLPFNKWLGLSLDKKKEFIKEKGISTSDVPMFSLRDAALLLNGESIAEDEFTKALLLGAIHYSEYWDNSTRRYYDGYNTDFSVTSFAESLAFIYQITEIARRYGQIGETVANQMRIHAFEQFQRLGKEHRENGRILSENDYLGYARYTTAFTFAWRYSAQKQININYFYPFISYLLFWTLCPNMLHDSRESVPPRIRMEKLLNLDLIGIDLGLNRDEKLFDLFRNPLDTYRQWDQCIGTSYVGTNIRISSLSQVTNLDVASTPIEFEATYKTLLQSLFQMINNLRTMGFKETADYMYNICESMYMMSKGFCSNPTMYLYPGSYLKNIDEFVNVPYKIEFVNVDPLKNGECQIKREGVSIVDGCIYGDTLRTSNERMEKDLDWRLYVNAEKNISFSEVLYGNSDLDSVVINDFLPGVKTWFFDAFE